MHSSLTYKKLFSALTIISLCLFFQIGILRNGSIPEDLVVYFNSSHWVYGPGTLYREVPSEYPLLANLIFSLVRLFTFNRDQTPIVFSLIWVGINAILLVGIVSAVIQMTKSQGKSDWIFILASWLLPSTIYFALFRYDIYPAATSLLMMWSFRNEKWGAASLWLGITIALKGYAIFLLPTLFIYLHYKVNFKYAIKMVTIALIPFVLSLIATASFSGIEGMISPFKFHAIREINSDSVYQLFRFCCAPNLKAANIPFIPLALQIFCSLITIFFRPRDFQGLINCFAFVILGFISFSIFYSPQFLLWVLPILCFSKSKLILKTLYAYSLITLGYLLFLAYPTLIIFEALITFLSIIRFYLMWILASETLKLKLL